MPYVYAIAFANGIVKFGRTNNVFRRVQEHKTNGAQQGAHPTFVLMAAVNDDAREEAMLLSAASSKMQKVSRESFMYGTPDKIAQVMRDCRLPFILCKIASSPFRMVIDNDSFAADLNLANVGAASVSALDKVPNKSLRMKIAYVLRGGTIATASYIQDRIPNSGFWNIVAALKDMVKEGSIECKEFNGFARDKGSREGTHYKYKETPIARQIYP